MSKLIESARSFALRLGDMVDAEFADSGVDLDLPTMIAAIEADRTAVRLAARLELLAELRACAAACPGTGDERYEHLFSALEIRDKASQ